MVGLLLFAFCCEFRCALLHRIQEISFSSCCRFLCADDEVAIEVEQFFFDTAGSSRNASFGGSCGK